MKKLVYAAFLMLALFTSQNVNNLPIIPADGAHPYGFKNAAEKIFSIQRAINSAGEGDTIYVPSGTYMENLKINRSIRLIANGTVEIMPNNQNDNVVEVLKNNVTIIGFTILNQGGICGIRIRGVGDYRIVGNKVLGGDYGLMINGSNNGLLVENEVRGCVFGIYLYESFGNTVTRNTVEASKYGIILSLSSNNRILENKAINCTYGFYSHISSENNVSKNTFQGNEMGVAIIRSRMSLILLNEFLSNFYGAYLDDARRSLLAGNNVTGGLIGIKIMGSQNITILDNIVRFTTNHIAIDSSINMTVSGNTLEYAKGHGIIIYETAKSLLLENTLSYCRVGVSVENCRSTRIENNLAENNSYGLYLFRSSGILLSRNKCGNNAIADFYSEGSEGTIVEKLQINGYDNNEISFTYEGDVSVKGSGPIEFTGGRLLSGFFNITLLSPGSRIRVNVTYKLKDIQREEPVLYQWTGVEWKKVRGSVANESSSIGLASFLLTETGIYVLGVGEKTSEQLLQLTRLIISVLILCIVTYWILRTLRAGRTH